MYMHVNNSVKPKIFAKIHNKCFESVRSVLGTSMEEGREGARTNLQKHCTMDTLLQLHVHALVEKWQLTLYSTYLTSLSL